MSTTIPCIVETTPMANEIKRVTNSVQGTTAAVVTMQSAVIAAENAAATKVCENVNRGFFTLMRSQISQKIAAKHSRVEALLMQMAQQKRQLLAIKSNMEKEYGRISERYFRIFSTINKELEHRIVEVDRPVFDIVNKHMATSSNRMYALTAWAATSQTEGITDSQQIIVSNMKHNAQIALNQSADFLTQISEQRVLAEKVLVTNPAGNEDKMEYIPVVISETVSDSSSTTVTDVNIPEYVSAQNATMINSAIRAADNLRWERKSEKDRVDEEFMRILSNSGISDRVKNAIRSLYDSSSFDTL